jgi:hypothetical protein
MSEVNLIWFVPRSKSISESQVNVSPFTEFVNDNPQDIHGFKSNIRVQGRVVRRAADIRQNGSIRGEIQVS